LRWLARFLNFFNTEQENSLQLESVLGFRPKNIIFYDQALRHSSGPEEISESNERLEFLGDAVLGLVIGEYLFKKYPSQPEGFLTELRSRIVRRETMNSVAQRMGIHKLVQYNKQDRSLNRSHIFGNALEALIGAVYLDQGLAVARSFILNQVVKLHVDLETIEQVDTNYKNQLLSWAQRNGHLLAFETISEEVERTRKLFTIGIMLNGELIVTGNGYSKKEAGQVAAKNALAHLNIPIGNTGMG
jgi:ribonuclease III